MITQYTIKGDDWTAISAAGESGSCWLDEDGAGSVGSADVRIYHAAAKPAVAKKTEAKRVYRPAGNTDVMLLAADNASDIFYAICFDEDAEAIITADVI